MAKAKKPAVPAKPTAIPDVPLDWLQSPKAMVGTDPPLDWLEEPKVVVGQDENLAAIPRRPGDGDLAGVLRPGDALASTREKNARKREQKAASEAAPASPTPRVWAGKVSDLAEKIVDDHRAELAAGTITETALLEREAPLWHKPNGKPFSAASMRNLLKQRRNKRAGKI